MDLGLNGRTFIVVGSTSGLGRASAEALGREGANVVVSGRRLEVAEQLAATLPSAAATKVDLNADESVEHLVAFARERFESVDGLVLNSGGPTAGSADDIQLADVRTTVRALLERQIELVGLCMPELRRQQWGRVLAVGSVGVQQPIPGLALSNIGRAALAAYLKTLAGEVAEDGVTVNMVLPGRIATARARGLDDARARRDGLTREEVEQASRAAIPARRYGRPEEFGAVVCFLASEAASYVTGEQIRCDGGLVGSY